MRVTFGVATDIGRARERNEDSYLAQEPLFAVADGMGGHRAGDVASALALQTLQDIAASGDWDGLVDQVRKANRVVFDRSTGDRSLSGMGTTLTAALIGDSAVRLVHVGDSRAYLVRDGELRMLTEDHTLVQRMVREGKISAEEAGNHPQRSILTRALGVEEDVPVDEVSVEPRSGDRILLCTDGLTGMMRDASIAEILQNTPDPQEAAEKLVNAANRAGGLDNITVLILDFSDARRAPGEDGDAARATRTVAGTAPAGAAVPSAEERSTPAPRSGEDTVAIQAVEDRAPSDRGAGPPRRRGIRILVWLLAVVAAVGLAFLGIRLYVNSQWYVGVDEGNVAIFKGIPAEPLGISLHHVVERTELSAQDAQQLASWRRLPDGINADSEERARSIVEQIRDDLADAGGEGGPVQAPEPEATGETATPETGTPEPEGTG